MKRTLSLLALCAGLTVTSTAQLPITGAHAAALKAPALASDNCHSRNYQPGNCKHIPPGKAGRIENPAPGKNDAKTILYVPATRHGLEVTANLVQAPGKALNVKAFRSQSVKGTAAYSISAVDAKTNAIKKKFNPAMQLKIDPKYRLCTYNVSTGKCKLLKLTHHRYSITGPGTYVLVTNK